MEGFSVGAVLAGVVSTLIVAILGIGILKRRKTNLNIKNSTIGGHVTQDISDCNNYDDNEQSLDLDNVGVNGNVSQTNSSKKKR